MAPTVAGAAYLTSTITSIVASVTIIIALFYLTGLYLLFHRMPKDEKLVNKCSSFRLQRYAPFVYLLVTLSSLAEIAVSCWLIAQYRYNNNYPNVQTRNGVCVTLACACWTCISAGSYLVLFLHPTWSMLPISSVGAQAVWILFTWVFWIASTAAIDNDLPFVLAAGACGLVYCSQLQALFALAVAQIVILTLAMFIVVWLAWRSMQGH